jgi:hypothetical protein
MPEITSPAGRGLGFALTTLGHIRPLKYTVSPNTRRPPRPGAWRARWPTRGCRPSREHQSPDYQHASDRAGAEAANDETLEVASHVDRRAGDAASRQRPLAGRRVEDVAFADAVLTIP